MESTAICEAVAPPAAIKLRLDEISTRWPELHDPLLFAMRYAPAIQAYLSAQIRVAADAEDVLQDFLLQVVQHRFHSVLREKGRFRDYLKSAVQRAIWAYHERRGRRAFEPLVEDDAQVEDGRMTLEAEWLSAWRVCLLERAWEALAQHEQASRRSAFYTVLRLSSEHPQLDAETLAAQASALLDRPLGAAAFRQQLCRARRQFARLLIEEVAKTLLAIEPDDVLDELRELGLFSLVRDSLPARLRAAELQPA